MNLVVETLDTRKKWEIRWFIRHQDSYFSFGDIYPLPAWKFEIPEVYSWLGYSPSIFTPFNSQTNFLKPKTVIEPYRLSTQLSFNDLKVFRKLLGVELLLCCSFCYNADGLYYRTRFGNQNLRVFEKQLFIENIFLSKWNLEDTQVSASTELHWIR